VPDSKNIGVSAEQQLKFLFPSAFFPAVKQWSATARKHLTGVVLDSDDTLAFLDPVSFMEQVIGLVPMLHIAFADSMRVIFQSCIADNEQF
jgi:hypothetical protein